jgi:transmembrane sensor
MDKFHFITLLEKYLNGSATQEEKAFLEDYYDVYQNDPEVSAFLSTGDKELIQSEINKGIWASIDTESQYSDYPEQKRSPWFRRISVAATLLFSLSAGLYFFNNKTETSKTVAGPTPTKEHRLIRLPDGSTVIVNAGSTLNYPSSFDDTPNREVYLDGQAYFDVKPNAAKPFIIHTGKVSTTVLGTAFNIEAWPEARNVTVTVTRGKVRVEDRDKKVLGIITPDQQIIYDNENSDAVQNSVKATDFVAWKDGDLLLENVTLAEATELLAIRYHVDIEISESLVRTKRFTTTFLQKESLDKILETICEFTGASYTFDKERGQVTLSSKQ